MLTDDRLVADHHPFSDHAPHGALSHAMVPVQTPPRGAGVCQLLSNKQVLYIMMEATSSINSTRDTHQVRAIELVYARVFAWCQDSDALSDGVVGHLRILNRAQTVNPKLSTRARLSATRESPIAIQLFTFHTELLITYPTLRPFSREWPSWTAVHCDATCMMTRIIRGERGIVLYSTRYMSGVRLSKHII